MQYVAIQLFPIKFSFDSVGKFKHPLALLLYLENCLGSTVEICLNYSFGGSKPNSVAITLRKS